jgi:short-subunit dehydrogenase
MFLRMGSVATRSGRSPALLKFSLDSLSSVVPSLREALQPFSALVVTGGSSGIGKSFIQLGETLKPDLVFCNLSRTAPAENIFSNPRKKLNHISCDLSDGAQVPRAAADVLGVLANAGVSGRILLVNNSGFGTFGRFSEVPLDRQLAMIDLNVRALVQLTGLLLPHLQSRGGAIMNIASTLGHMPAPYAATYGATKAFVRHWSLALHEELRGTNVHVITVSPGTTRTEFFRVAGSRTDDARMRSAMTPDSVAKKALAALAAGRPEVVTGWGNKTYTFASACLPKSVSARIVGKVLARRDPAGAGS